MTIKKQIIELLKENLDGITARELTCRFYQDGNTRGRRAKISSYLTWLKMHGYISNREGKWFFINKTHEFMERNRREDVFKVDRIYSSAIMQRKILRIFTKDDFNRISMANLTAIVYETDKIHHLQKRSVSACLNYLARKKVVYNNNFIWYARDYAKQYYDFILKNKKK